MTNSTEFDRRNFLSLAGKGLGLAALSSATVALPERDRSGNQKRLAPYSARGGDE